MKRERIRSGSRDRDLQKHGAAMAQDLGQVFGRFPLPDPSHIYDKRLGVRRL